MKQKLLIIELVFLVCILPFSSAYVVKYNDWVYDLDTLTLDNQSFKFKISSSSENIIAYYSDKSQIIRKGNCADDSLTLICLDNISTDEVNEIRTARISISYLEPNLSILRTSNKEEVNVGDPITFDLKVKNVGDFKARNLVYTDYFPTEIIISKVSGKCIKDEYNTIKYETDLNPGESFGCSYSVIPSKETEQTLRAQIDYDDGFTHKKVYSNSSKIKSKSLYKITAYHERYEGNSSNRILNSISLDNSEVQVGEEFNVRINLTNMVNEDITFNNFSAIFPKEFIIKRSTMQLDGNSAYWHGELLENSTREFYFTLLSKEGGNFEINYLADITKRNIIFEKMNSKTDFKINAGGIELSSNLDNHSTFDSSKEMYLMFAGKNMYNFTDISSGTVIITSDLLPEVQVPIGKVLKGDTFSIYQTAILPRNVTASTVKKIKVEATYITEYGVKKTETKEWSATIKPIKDIEITKTLSKSKITEGDDVIVIVKVKNTRSRPIYNMNLEDVTPIGIERSGRTKASIEMLYPDESVTVYNYTIKAPNVKNESKFIIKTLLSYLEDMKTVEIKSEKILNISNELNFVVYPKKLSLSLKKSSDYTTIDLGETVKIIYSIENKDTETAYDINFFFSKDKYTDLINEYTYHIDRLEPGELMTFKREVVKPKKTGNYAIGETLVTFKDIDDNLFNYTLNSLSINVQNRSISWPSMILEKTLSKSKITEGEVLNVTLIAENMGDEGADLTLTDQNNQRKTVYIGAKKQENYTYSLIVHANEIITDAYGLYTYQGNEYRAVAKAPSLIIDSKKIPLKNEQKTVLAETWKNETEIKTNESAVNQISLVDKIKTKIKSWFGFT